MICGELGLQLSISEAARWDEAVQKMLRRYLPTTLKRLTFPFLFLLLFSGFAASATLENPTPLHVTAQLWRAVEIDLVSEKNYDDPYADVEVTAIFNGPGGETISRPAFWAGGANWKIRFAPTAIGEWTFSTTATDAADAGLNGQTGVVTATAYEGDLAVYRHGFVRSHSGHNLVYQDGTPFFWLGYELWGLDYGRLHGSNKTDWKSNPAHSESQILATIDHAASEQFNAVNVAFFNHWVLDEARRPKPDKIWVDRFNEFYDPVMALLADRGMTVNLTIGLSGADYQPAEVLKRYARYVVARYGAYPVVWNVAEPDAPPNSRGAENPPASHARNLGEMLAYTSDIDGYHHPVGPWYRETAVDEAPDHQHPTLYLDKPWVGVIVSQCGHMKAPGDYSQGGRQPIDVYRFYYENFPQIPMIEAGGCNYTNIFQGVDDYVTRRSAWRAVQAGSSGFGFGAHGVWNFQWDATTPSNGGRLYQVVPWRSGLDTPASAQMKWLKTFYTSLPWVSMKPRYGTSSLTVIGSPVDEISQPLVRADDESKNVAVYFPAEFPSTSIAQLKNLAPAPYTARWYNPRTGKFSLIDAAASPIDGEWGAPQKPDEYDWVLLLKKPSPRNAPASPARP